MKHFIVTGVLCGCLLIGSFYPQMILEHHMRFVDENGKESIIQGEFDSELPLELRFRFLRFFR